MAKYSLPGKVTCHGSVDSLVHDRSVDMVAVSVKVPEHYALIKPALQAHKDIFVEWPLAANLAQAEELTALAQSQKVKTMVGLQARQDPSVRRAREMVLRNELGAILGTTMVGFGGIFDATATSYSEYLMPLENGANLVTIPAGHALDALCYVLGEFKDLQATLANNRPKIAIVDADGKVLKTVDKSAHDHMAVTGTLARGGVATVVYQPGSSRNGRGFYWEIVGTKGTLVLEGGNGHVQMFHPKLTFVKADKDAKADELEPEAAVPDFSYNVGKAWDAFVGQGPGSVTTFEDALVRHRMIDAIYRSNANGTRESYI